MAYIGRPLFGPFFYNNPNKNTDFTPEQIKYIEDNILKPYITTDKLSTKSQADINKITKDFPGIIDKLNNLEKKQIKIADLKPIENQLNNKIDANSKTLTPEQLAIINGKIKQSTVSGIYDTQLQQVKNDILLLLNKQKESDKILATFETVKNEFATFIQANEIAKIDSRSVNDTLVTNIVNREINTNEKILKLESTQSDLNTKLEQNNLEQNTKIKTQTTILANNSTQINSIEDKISKLGTVQNVLSNNINLIKKENREINESVDLFKTAMMTTSSRIDAIKTELGKSIKTSVKELIKEYEDKNPSVAGDITNLTDSNKNTLLQLQKLLNDYNKLNKSINDIESNSSSNTDEIAIFNRTIKSIEDRLKNLPNTESTSNIQDKIDVLVKAVGSLYAVQLEQMDENTKTDLLKQYYTNIANIYQTK